MFKRFFSIVLFLSMLMVVPTSAANSMSKECTYDTDKYTMAEYKSIEAEREYLYDLVDMQIATADLPGNPDYCHDLVDKSIEKRYYTSEKTIPVYSQNIEIKASRQSYTTFELSFIEAEREALYESFKVQLAAQNAADEFEFFKSVADSMIDGKYFLSELSSTDRIYAPNGGVVKKYSTMVETTYTYFGETETKQMYDARNDPNVLEDLGILLLELGFNALDVGEFTQILNAIPYIEESQWNRIMNGTECMFNIKTYDNFSGTYTRLFSEWGSAPYMNTSDEGVYDRVEYEVNEY